MAAEKVSLLLERCEAAQKLVFSVEDGQEVGEAETPASVMVPYLIDSRRKLKLMSRQQCVLDYFLILLETLESPDELLNNPCPQNIGRYENAHAKWKALKSEYREGVQRVQDSIVILQDKMEQANKKKEMIGQLMTNLERKRAEMKEKERLKQKMNKKAERQASAKLQELELAEDACQRALQQMEQKMTHLRAEIDSCQATLDSWTELRDELKGSIQATLEMTGYRLQWVGEKELCVELRPQVYQPSLGDVNPLCLSLTWTTDGIFHIKASQGAMDLLPESLHGPLSQVSTALLEIMQSYLSQSEMLAEIQHLQSRFAIDWRPTGRQLIFLKSSSIVCHLHVEMGYPSKGRVSLVSVRGEKGPVNISSLQPLHENASLTEWLKYLSTSMQI
ncbi:ZW10 interactor [Arapaima gigas]